MSAKDIFHNAVRSALEKEGWIITHDPLFIKVEELDFFIDLAGQKIIAAEKDGLKIAVEIKSFIAASDLASFYNALGQFLSYRSALRKKQPNRFLYLAISQDVYNDFFTNRFIQELIAEHKLKLIIFDPIQKEIVLWKE